MTNILAKTVTTLLWGACAMSIVSAGLCIYAVVTLCGCPEPYSTLVYGIWLAITTFRLSVDSRSWARLTVMIRDRLSDSYRASPRAKS